MRKINFNAGPATLPNIVLEQAAEAILNYNNTGVSILELPHRGKEFLAIVNESNSLVRELCNLSHDYEILWQQGGGRQQFYTIPMNFLPENGVAGYIDSGHWSSEALQYAGYYGKVETITSTKNIGYIRLPDIPAVLPNNLAYLHLTTNNTIYGSQWQLFPKTTIPLIADMSSDILSCIRDYTKFAMYYAVAQKNLGIAGCTLIVIRRDFLKQQVRTLPPMLNYKEHIKENSVLNTANVFGIYVSMLMLRWLKSKGLKQIFDENIEKANILYNTIDNSNYFETYIKEKTHRSQMNVCFVAKNPEYEQKFISLCEQNNITGYKGHRLVGGFRVSLYNAVTVESVRKLAEIINGL